MSASDYSWGWLRFNKYGEWHQGRRIPAQVDRWETLCGKRVTSRKPERGTEHSAPPGAVCNSCIVRRKDEDRV